jgi:hypothetical protein
MRLIIVASALALAACNPAQETSETTMPAQSLPPLAGACATSASSAWNELSVIAESGGDDCAAATARITIRNAAGDILFTQDNPSNQVMTLVGAESVEDMQRRLGEWITPAGAMMDSASDLPEWADGDDQPMSGEFPFYIDHGVDRAAYTALRQRDAPLFCFVQGMESLACFIYEGGALTHVGEQSFPG